MLMESPVASHSSAAVSAAAEKAVLYNSNSVEHFVKLILKNNRRKIIWCTVPLLKERDKRVRLMSNVPNAQVSDTISDAMKYKSRLPKNSSCHK